MDENNQLIKKIVKYKKLQVLSNSKAFIVPKSWLIAMDWDEHTKFVMEIHPLRKEFIVTEMQSGATAKAEPINEVEEILNAAREQNANHDGQEVSGAKPGTDQLHPELGEEYE